MNIIRTVRFVCFTLFLLAAGLPATAQVGFTDAEALAIKAFLQQNFGNTNAGMVIGLLDANGNGIISAGKLDNGTSQEVSSESAHGDGTRCGRQARALLQPAGHGGRGRAALNGQRSTEISLS